MGPHPRSHGTADRRHRPRRVSVPTTMLAIIALLGVLVAGLVAGSGAGMLLLGVGAFVVALAVGIVNWRWSVLALLAYIPIAGLPEIALYPNGGPALLIKDILFVLPAYVGFAYGAWMRRRWRVGFPGAPTALLFALALLVMVEAANPHLGNRLVGLIGIKLWLFYLPLIYLGYHFVRDRRDLNRLLGTVALGALVPAVVGLVEAALVYSGHSQTVYGWYGPAAKAVTQNFVAFDVGGTGLTRLPSTFPYFVQYWQFTAAAMACAYAWWRGDPRRRRRPWGLALLLVIATAGMTSGARGAFVFLPLLMLMIALLDRVGVVRLLALAIAATTTVLVALLVLGVAFSPLADLTFSQGAKVSSLFTDALGNLGSFGAFGWGSGIDSGGARYAYHNSQDAGVVFAPLGGVWYEAWWLKAFIEVGAAGLAVLLLLLYRLLGPALRQHVALQDRMLRSVSAALIALLLWNLIYSFKAQYIDVDPMDVYFWLLAGVVLKLATLDGAGDKQPTVAKAPNTRLRIPIAAPAQAPGAADITPTR